MKIGRLRQGVEEEEKSKQASESPGRKKDPREVFQNDKHLAKEMKSERVVCGAERDIGSTRSKSQKNGRDRKVGVKNL